MMATIRVDERGRITIPGEMRESLGIGPDTQLVIEKKGPALVISKELTPDEFIREARGLQEEIRASKSESVEPLKVKEVWKGSPRDDRG